MPKFSSSTFAIGATQLVVQEALEMMWWCAGSYLSSLTPITIVMSSSLAGAEMITFLAPPSMWAAACLPLLNRPVDSRTMSTPRSAQGRLAGSRSARIFIDLSPTRMVSPETLTGSFRLPITVSYLSRCAIVATSPRSFAATISIPRSLPAAFTVFQKFRPMRPNPLIPTRVVTAPISSPLRLARRVRRPAGRTTLPGKLSDMEGSDADPGGLPRVAPDLAALRPVLAPCRAGIRMPMV